MIPLDDSKYNLTRDQAMIGLLYGCGLRRSEIIKAEWGDLDFHRQVLKVEGKGRKFRMVPVNDYLVIILKKLKKLATSAWGVGNDMRIILMDNGQPCYPKYVHNRVIELIGTVSTAEKKSPHVLRHSMATHLMDRGAELNAVKGILGHASLAATQVYTHNSISRLKEVYRQAHPKSIKDG
jgi:integrase/recombinase XerC